MQAPSLRRAALVLLGLSLALGSCESSGKSSATATRSGSVTDGRAQLTNEIVATATVTAIDTPTRMLTLKREDGTAMRIQCGTPVRNFDKIGVGDKLKVKCMESLVATRLPAGASATPSGVAVAAGRAEKGAQPAAGVGVAASVCATIRSVDLEQQMVFFTLPSGEKISRHVVTPEGREFIKGLKAGDKVQLDYAEVVAITVEKVES